MNADAMRSRAHSNSIPTSSPEHRRLSNSGFGCLYGEHDPGSHDTTRLPIRTYDRGSSEYQRPDGAATGDGRAMSDFGRAFLAQMDSEDLAWLRAALGIDAAKPNEPDPLLTTKEAAVIARVNVETIRRHVNAGTLDADRTGSRIKLRQSNLEEWMRTETARTSTTQIASRRSRRTTSSSTMSDAFKQAA